MTRRALFICPYTEAFDESPAWWPAAQRDALLAGSPVCEDAAKLAEDVRSDFERFVRGAIRSGGGGGGAGSGGDGVDGSGESGSIGGSGGRAGGENRNRKEQEDESEEAGGFERFRRAVAAIHSRSYHTGGTGEAAEAEGGALVPLLDIANHFRKPRESAWEAVDVEAPAAMGAASEDTARGGDSGKSIVVTALRSFDPGDPIRISYGARGNAELLLRYGFTIPDNTEPDGSSNDTRRIAVTTGGGSGSTAGGSGGGGGGGGGGGNGVGGSGGGSSGSGGGGDGSGGSGGGDTVADDGGGSGGGGGSGSGGGGTVVELRVASRALYTYPPLAQALDALKREAVAATGGGGSGASVGAFGGAESFDIGDEGAWGGGHDDEEEECAEEGDGEGGHDGWGDMYGAGSEEDGDEDGDDNGDDAFGSGGAGLAAEISALTSFADILRGQLEVRWCTLIPG